MKVILAQKSHLLNIEKMINRRNKIEGKNNDAMKFIRESIQLKLCWIIEQEGNVIGISNGFADKLIINGPFKIFYWMNMYIEKEYRNGMIYNWFSKKLEAQIRKLGFDIIMALVWRPEIIKLHKLNKYREEKIFYLNFVFPFSSVTHPFVKSPLTKRSVVWFKQCKLKIKFINTLKYYGIPLKILQYNTRFRMIYSIIHFPLFYLNSEKSLFTVREYTLITKSLNGSDLSTFFDDFYLEAGDHDAL